MTRNPALDFGVNTWALLHQQWSAPLNEALLLLDPDGLVHSYNQAALALMPEIPADKLFSLFTLFDSASQILLKQWFGDENQKKASRRWPGSTYQLRLKPKPNKSGQTVALTLWAIRDQQASMHALAGRLCPCTRTNDDSSWLNAFFQHSTEGHLLCTPQGAVTRCNPALSTLLGYSQEEVRSLAPEMLWQERTNGPFRHILHALHSAPNRGKHLMLLNQQGQAVAINLRLARQTEDGLALLLTAQTSQQELEQQLARAEQDRDRQAMEWEKIFQAISHPTLILDPAHMILDANQACLEAMGKTLDEIKGKACYTFFHQTDQPPANCPVLSLAQQTMDREMRVEMVQGTYLVSCTPLLDAHGHLDKVLHIAMDISEKKLTEQKLARHQKVLEEVQHIQRLVIEDAPDEQLFESVVQTALFLSQSSLGFIAEINTADQAISGPLIRSLIGRGWSESCKHFYQDLAHNNLLPADLTAYCHDLLQSKKPVFLQPQEAAEPGTEPHVLSFLGLPILREENIVGLLGVANSPTPYTHDLVQELGPLLTTATAVISFTRHRHQQQATALFLERSEAVFREIFNASSSGKALTLPDGRLYRTNQAFSELLGYSQEELQRMSLEDITHPDDQEASRHLMAEMCHGHITNYHLEKRYIRANGSQVWATIYTTLLRDQQGQPVYFVTDIYDVTSKKRAEATLRHQHELLQTILANIPLMVILLNAQGDILWVNKTWEQAHGVDFHQIQQPAIWGCLYPEPLVRQQWLATVQEADGQWHTFQTWREPGTIMDTAWVHVRLTDQSIIGIGEDITERLQEEQQRQGLAEQLLQVQKLESVGRLAGGIAHDFNNLLSVILGFAELTLMGMPAEHPHGDKLKQIVQAATRAKDLTRQLLAFSRKQVFQMQPVHLNEVISGFEKLLRRMLREDIVMELQLCQEATPIQADIAQIEQVLMNLAINARDAMPDGGFLLMKTSCVELQEKDLLAHHPDMARGQYIQLTVSDNGIGMDTTIQAQIFEPFFTTKASLEGTGLGLSTVYGIVKQHGGHICVYSEPGHGTSFTLFFPRVSRSRQPREKKQYSAAGKRVPRTILVVEDDPKVLELATTLLEYGGHRVLIGGIPKNALEVARKYSAPLDLVLTDVVMPKMKGPEIYALIQTIHPEAKVLYMSGYPEHSLFQLNPAKEQDHFIQKPLTIHALLEKIDRLFSR